MKNKIDNRETIEPVTADQDEYLIRSRVEIAAILNTLCQAGSMITAYFGSDNDFTLTAILAVRPGEDEVIMDYGADADANQRALQAGKITFVAAHERIKVQFVAASLRQVRFEGRDAFSMRLPAALLRLQRREYFRIVAPLLRPLRCVITPQGAPSGAPAEATIVDISCGGIAIIDCRQPVNLEIGACLRNCRIQLPGIGTVTATMLIKSNYDVTLKNGARHRHAGCEFVDLPESVRALVQRYINRMESERKYRSGGR
jgi:c-di-GMP-binding flagellar brake protein YcgR